MPPTHKKFRMLKIYAISGFVERYICVPLGKTRKASITFHFKGGAIDSALRRDATFATSNLAEQALIESLPDFKRGVIKIYKVIPDKPKANAQAKTEQPGSYPDVTNVQSARAVLGGMGVPIELLQSKADVLQQAKERGITFPNWR